MVEWTEDSLEELLEKSIGDIREMLAHEDADTDFKTFLVENGWIETDDEEDDDDYDYEDEDEEEEEEDWDEDEEEDDDIELPYDQEILAQDIARDIASGAYTIDAICGVYDTDFINRVKQLVR